MIRDNMTLLDGPWEFYFDDRQTPGWNPGDADVQTIQVPYSYHTKASGIEDTTEHTHMAYRRILTIDPLEDERLHLVFEGVDHESFVYLNNQLVHHNIGGYHRFQIDITDHVHPGDNGLVVYVIDTKSKDQLRGKQRYTKDNFECWYIETSGIWKSVWLERTQPSHISSFDLTCKKDRLIVDAAIEHNSSDHHLEVTLFFDGNDVQKHSVNTYDLPCRIELPEDLLFWHPDHPHLYDVKLDLYQGNTHLDTIWSYIGIRTIETKGEQILLNGEPLYQKLILNQAYYGEDHLHGSVTAMEEDIRLMKEMGFNGCRIHEKIEDQRFHYLSDYLGLLNWLEIPSPYVFTPRSVQWFQDEVTHIIPQFRHHPSIIAWVVYNESWGIPDIRTNIVEQRTSDKMVALVERLDGTRPIISNDGWEHTTSDWITLHDYKQDAKDLYDTYQDLDRILNNEDVTPTPPRKAFASGYSYKGQPVLLSEFAGIAMQGDDGWGYGEGVRDQEELIERLRSLVDVVRRIPRFQGYCITQLTDVQQEVNGLLYEDRTPKIPIHVIRWINDSVNR
jgi:beta-galactosidase/beta-glucuronidase